MGRRRKETKPVTGAELEKIREARGEGADVFASRLGVPDEGTYWLYVYGKRRIPEHVQEAARTMAG